MKILVVDDEKLLVKGIKFNLENEGYQVLTAYDGATAVELARQETLDLIILDLMMPGLSGSEACMKIREFSDVPIIMLTARSEDADKIIGLESGADDYVTKPFSPIVLAARVRTLLKREGRAASPLEAIGLLSVNELRREVLVEDQPVDLTPKEYELLIYFKNNRSIALSRESILNAVWGYDYFGDLRTVDTHVKKLRAKLGCCGSMIETVRGYGYRFEG